MYAFTDAAEVSTLLSIDGRYRLNYAGKDKSGAEVYDVYLNLVPCIRRLNAMGFVLSTFYGKPWAKTFNCHILKDGIPKRFRNVPHLSMPHVVPAELKRLGYSCQVIGYGEAGYGLKIGVDEATFEGLLTVN